MNPTTIVFTNKPSYLSASKARELASPKHDAYAQDILDEIMRTIEEAAKKGEFSVKYRNADFSDSALYTHTNSLSSAGKLVLNALTEMGYKTSIGVDEKQFVDIYLKIMW